MTIPKLSEISSQSSFSLAIPLAPLGRSGASTRGCSCPRCSLSCPVAQSLSHRRSSRPGRSSPFCRSSRSCARRLRLVREVVVHDVRDSVDVETPGCHVSGDEYLLASIPESVEDLLPLVLAMSPCSEAESTPCLSSLSPSMSTILLVFVNMSIWSSRSCWPRSSQCPHLVQSPYLDGELVYLWHLYLEVLAHHVNGVFGEFLCGI